MLLANWSPNSVRSICRAGNAVGSPDKMNTSPFDRLFRPESVAVIGASPQRGLPRNTLLRMLLKHGFAGKVFPVSLSHPEIEGLKAYPSVGDLPEVPDVALVITPADTVPGVIAECGRKGIRSAVVFSAGFEEVEEGRENAIRLAAAAKEHGVTVLGPNCQGIWSVRHKAMLTYSPAAMALDSIELAPIAVVSQSGALAGAIAGALQKSGIGCSYITSVGNETCIDLLKVLGWIVEQDDVRAVALYIEGLNDAGRLIQIARRASERGVQIIALKAGSSAVGQEATASHTGKIASPHTIYQDVFEQAGVIGVDSLTEMLAAVEAIAFLPDPRVTGGERGGVSVMSTSGGAGALLADHSDKYSIPMAEFSEATGLALEKMLPSFARKANPVDLTGQIRSHPNLFKDTCSVLAQDARTEAMVVQFASSGMRDLMENGDTFKAVAREQRLPVIIGFVAERLDVATRSEFRNAGILLTDDTSATMRALSFIYKRQRYASRKDGPAGKPLPVRVAPATWQETMDYLGDAGVQPAKWVVLQPGERAVTACAGLKYPLVVKVLPSESDHKTELGLVKLRVGSPEEVDGHAAEFRAKLGKPEMGVLVQEMVGEGVEVIVSCMRKTDFGPVISIGMGGIAVELFKDITHLALPVTPAQVKAALKKLKLWTLLNGFRGKPAADIDGLAEAAARFGDLFLSAPEVQEIEVNPLIVRPAGEGVIAVDALIAIKS